MKIQPFILGICILYASAARSQSPWTTSGSDIYNSNAGNVGIGTSSPGYKLEVNGTAKLSSSVWTGRLSVGAANVSTEQFYLYNDYSNVIIQNTSTGGYIRNLYMDSSASKFALGYNLSGSDQKFGIYDYSVNTWKFVLDGGKVGIGMVSPLYQLDVNGIARSQGFTGQYYTADNTNGYYGSFFVQDVNGWAINYLGGSNIARINNTGIGIGTTPGYKLDVLKSTTGQTSSNRVGNFSNAGATFNTTSAALSSYSGYFSSTSTRSTGSDSLTNIGLYATASGAQKNYAAIFDQGLVTIGSVSSYVSGYKLAVAGNIIAEKVRVKLQSTGWPDYVFDDKYLLPTLKETALFIKDKKHLPGVPSAIEIEKEGLDLGDGQALLLKKIEELTLHLIEMDRRMEKIEAENKELKNKLKKQ